MKNIVNILNDNSLEYAAYVISDRALPDIRDGLKPVHRRILFTMDRMNAYSFTKSANIEGKTMETHPHGGSYGAMVGMVQKDSNLTPYIIGKGNFAQHTSRDLQPGAPRYTEAKVSPLAKEILKDLDKKTVNYIPNYDGTIMMPEVLPVKFPTVLHTAQEGIAYGMASRIPSFNLIELNNAIIHYINTEEKTLLIPDFATGGYVINNKDVFEKINDEGSGSLRLRAKVEIKGNVLSITEIPYSTTREQIIEKVIELVKGGKLKEVTDIKDLTGLHGMEIEITCKKNTDMRLLLERLYQNTSMENAYSCNMNILHNGLPKVMGVWEIIDKWLDWRMDCIKNGLMHEIENLNQKLHLLKGLEKVLLDIDKAIEIIRRSDEDVINSNLKIEFNIDDIQADYISNMKLKNINKDYIIKQIKDIEALEDLISVKNNVLNSDESIKYIICEDLKSINSKYGQERKTQILTIDEKIKEVISKAKKEVPDYSVKLLVTKEGYVKKQNTSVRADQKLKDGDVVLEEFDTNNKNELVVFSGTDAFKIKIDALSNSKPSDMGDYIPNIIGVSEVVGYTVVDENYKFILVCYDNGKVAKVDLESFRTETSRKKLANSLNKNAKVVNILSFKNEEEFILIDKKNKEIVKHTQDLITKASRSTQGVNVARNIVNIKKGRA